MISARAKRRWLAGVVAAAVAGAALYALAPGVASYQIGFTLVVPLVIVVLVWLHRRLWKPVQWPLAILLAVGGAAGYLVWGGAQWWAWGKLAVLPLSLLIVWRGVSRVGPGVRSYPWYGGFRDGPWGPP